MLLAAGHHGDRLRAPLFEHRRHGRTMTYYAQSRRHLLHASSAQHSPSLYEIETLSALKAQWRPAVSIVTPYYNSANTSTKRWLRCNGRQPMTSNGSSSTTARPMRRRSPSSRRSRPQRLPMVWPALAFRPDAGTSAAREVRGRRRRGCVANVIICHSPCRFAKILLRLRRRRGRKAEVRTRSRGRGAGPAAPAWRNRRPGAG